MLSAKTGLREFDQQRDNGLQNGNNNEETFPLMCTSLASKHRYVFTKDNVKLFIMGKWLCSKLRSIFLIAHEETAQLWFCRSEILGLDNVIERRVFLDNYVFGLDGNLGWRNSWLNEDPTNLDLSLLPTSLLWSDHRLVEDHQKRHMGIYTILKFIAGVQMGILVAYSSSVGHVLVYARILEMFVRSVMLNVYMEIAKSSQCIIVLLTCGF
nr:hypothetical protein [Tanacetum cinerariifolium]